MENPDVSAVILTKNSARTIENCLKSVIAQKTCEIIAVDGGSTDATPSILKRYGVRVILDKSGSKGLSRQIGVQAAKGSFVMFIDSDVELCGDCVIRLRAEIDKYGWAGIHAKVLSRENLTRWQRAEDELYSIFYAAGPHREIPTMAALYRKEILLRFPFDPSFREASEDLDLCHRLRQNKHQVGVSSAAIAYHRHRREFSEFARQRFVYGLGDARFALKYKELRILADLTLLWLPITAKRIIRRRIRLLPCWLVGRLIQLLGFAVGLRSRKVDAHVAIEVMPTEM